MDTKNIRLQSRLDTQSQWETQNPVLLLNELGYESDTGRYKKGDGVKHWNELDYFSIGSITDTGEIFNGYFDDPTEEKNTINSATGKMSHAENGGTIASGNFSHAEGFNTIASGDNSHSEGLFTQAKGEHSHAEGSNTIALAYATHAEGKETQAKKNYAHAEGMKTIANGD